MGKCKLFTKSTDVLEEAVALQDLASSDWGGFGKKLSCHTLLASPRQSLKMLPSLIIVLEKDEASPHPAALPISSAEKFLSNTRSRD